MEKGRVRIFSVKYPKAFLDEAVELIIVETTRGQAGALRY